MSAIDKLLNQRTKKTDNPSKMAVMAQKSATGGLSGFSGIFSVSELTVAEKNQLEKLLQEFAHSEASNNNDLSSLISITAEVKAINNQAILLHGERIKKAKNLLKNYKDGAFTAWLMAAYGNRQTPYNFLQYYEFIESFPKQWQSKIETMPRQAVYVLAARQGDFDIKQQIVHNYQGENKQQLLKIIRETFPLGVNDKRRQNQGDFLIKQLDSLCQHFKQVELDITHTQKQHITFLLQKLNALINQ